jgi:DNA-3-methyladenine glycosylase II
MQRIETLDHIAEALDALCLLDPRLVAVREKAGEVPLRLSQPGFVSLASIITGQQVSRASAEAIFSRFTTLIDPLTPERLLAAGDEVYRQAGQSGAKQRTLVAIARAVVKEGLDLEGLCALEASEAISRLTAISGIGPWTAECYLLFSAGHPDVFPADDVALQSAVGDALGLDPRPSHKALRLMAESWAPWRAVAARLFWAYYREMKGREAVPLP